MNTTKPTQFIEPYLFFNGRCDEALEFYRKALGAEVLFLMRFKEHPEPPPPDRVPPGWENKVCHATIRIGGSMIMVSDGCSDGARFEGFSLSLAVTAEAEADTAFATRCARAREAGSGSSGSTAGPMSS